MSVAFASPVEQYRGTEADFEFFESQFAPELSVPDLLPPQDEIYGKSMNVMLAAGHVALDGIAEFGTGWKREVLGNSEVLRLKDEFETAVNEMIKTADGLGEYVTIERDDSFAVSDGRVLAKNNEPVADLISRGAKSSRQIAENSNSCYDIQADRDLADLALLTDFVEPMFSGAGHNVVLAISALPEDGIKRDGKKFWQGLGYNTEFECAMGQLYFAEPDGTLTTKVLSIDKSNVAKLAEKLRDRGVDVPEDVTPTELITHPITANMEYQEACELLKDFVVEYEDDAGLPPKITTTKQLVEQQSTLTNQAFEALYLPVAMSLACGVKTDETDQFVYAIQPATARMNEENALAIRVINNKNSFDADDAVVMHGAVLYSMAETLRSVIMPGITHSRSSSPVINVQPAAHMQWLQEQTFIDKMGGNLTRGVREGRSYGGCGAHIEFGDPLDPQGALGGKINTDIDKENKSDGPDGKGPLKFKCKNQHTVTRPLGGYAEYCPKCNESKEDRGKSVRC